MDVEGEGALVHVARPKRQAPDPSLIERTCHNMPIYPTNLYGAAYNSMQPMYAPMYQPRQEIYNPVPAISTSQSSVQSQGQQTFIVRPVASIEEARAVQTDFGGAMTIMPDTAHGAIYAKQLDYRTGAAIFKVYQENGPVVQDVPETPPAPVEYASRAELEEVRAQMANLLEKFQSSSTQAIEPERPKEGKGRDK